MNNSSLAKNIYSEYSMFKVKLHLFLVTQILVFLSLNHRFV